MLVCRSCDTKFEKPEDRKACEIKCGYRCESCNAGPGERHVPTEERPDDDQIEAWITDSVCEATDGCMVEPDGRCYHGHRSWLLVLGII